MAKKKTRTAMAMLTRATRWKASLHPAMPMIEVGASRSEIELPSMEPKLPVKRSQPKAAPRLVESVESATRD